MRNLFLILMLFSQTFLSAQSEFITTWKTDNPGSSGNNQITIPTFSGETYDYFVDWGDGNSDSNVIGNITHTYSAIDTYTVTITGLFPRIYFDNSGDKDKILTIEQWGNNPWTNFNDAFYGCSNLNITNQFIDQPDLSNLDRINNMFRACSNFNGDITQWNTTNITKMFAVFQDAINFNQDIGAWDVGNVDLVSNMFNGASSFNQDIGDWDTNLFFDLFGMFENATSFDQDLSRWDISSAFSTTNMFLGAELSRENYDALLIGWAIDNSGIQGDGIDDVPSGLRFHGGASKYCFGGVNRSNLETVLNWDITDGGADCPLTSSPFISTWEVTSDDLMVTIPVVEEGAYFYNVTWGDGTGNSAVTTSISHTYSTADTYTVSISGFFPRIHFLNSTEENRSKIKTIEQWGSNPWTSMKEAFFGCTNLDITNLSIDTPNLALVTDASRMFFGCTSFNGDIGNWQVGNIQDMSEMFALAESFNKEIGSWDVSKVTTMEDMFRDAKDFNQDLNMWDVSRVELMRRMFIRAESFNSNIRSWDVRKVRNMKSMFQGASTFNQDIGGWDVSNVSGVNLMFADAISFNQDISTWDVSNVLNMREMFNGASSFNQNIGDWVVSNVANMRSMFKGASVFNQDIGNWDVSRVIDMQGMFQDAVNFDQNLGSWDISNVANLTNFLSGAQISTVNYDALLLGWANDNSGTGGDGIDDIPSNLQFDGGLSRYCSSALARSLLESMTQGGFNWQIMDGGAECVDFEPFVTTWQTTSNNQSITIPTFPGEAYSYEVDWSYDGITFNAGNSNVNGNISHNYPTAGTYTVAIRGAFPRIYFLNLSDEERSKIQSIEQWGDIPWSSMKFAFVGCENLNITNTAIDIPDLSNVTSLAGMFISCTIFNGAIGNWDVSNVTDMSRIFESASSFNQCLGNWDVRSVIKMSDMFFAANSFNQTIDNWDVSGVENMQGMFREATSFNQDIGSWDVSSVVSLDAMFLLASSFNQCLSAWDVSKVESMNNMFLEAISFNQDIGSWDVGSVTNMNGMFYGAVSFNQDISDWDVSKVTDMRSMFRFATAFNRNIGGWDISNMVFMNSMFANAGLSVSNYDALLKGWSTDDSGTDGDGIDDVPINITLDVGSSKFCNSAFFKSLLESPLPSGFAWNITDDGVDCFGVEFITTWETTTTDETITIPTFPGETYNYTVEWGDEDLDLGMTGDAIHTYESPGIYTIKITGLFPRIYFNESGDRLKIRTIEQWGSNPWTSMRGAFHGCEMLKITDPEIDNPDLSNVSNTSLMFSGCLNFNAEIGSWDVSNVDSMFAMFAFTFEFNGDISMWDVGKVKVLTGMFGFTRDFNQDLSGWNVSNVQNFDRMFTNSVSFNQDIGVWDVSNANSMEGMFSRAESFDQNIGGWDISSVTDVRNMFEDSQLSTENYDALLIAWSTDESGVVGDGVDDVPIGLDFDAGSSQFCKGESAKMLLEDPSGLNWIISDDGVSSDCCNTSTTYSFGSWDNGIPSMTVNAIFNDHYNTSINGENIDACGVIVNPGVILTIDNNTELNLKEELMIYGDVIVKSLGTINAQNSN